MERRYLRAYLKGLPNFEDVEAEREALDWAENAEDVLWILALFANWPALDRAS
ncbi:MAG: DUF6880 family protein [Geminicoccales bacterium]